MIRAVFVAFFLSVTQLASAQAWIREKGAGFAQMGYSTIHASRIYNGGNTEVRLHRDVTDKTGGMYAELGIFNKGMITVNAPLKWTQTSTEIVEKGYLPDTLPSGTLRGVGNVSIALVYGLKTSGSYVSSLKLKVDLPTAQFQSISGLRTGYDGWGIAPVLCFGKGIGNYFFTSETGVNVRSNGYSTQFTQQLQAGRKVAQKAWLILVVDYLSSMQNGTYNDGTSIHTGLYQNNIQWTAILLKSGYLITPQWTVWGSIGAGVSGFAVARAPSFSLALSYEWKRKQP